MREAGKRLFLCHFLFPLSHSILSFLFLLSISPFSFRFHLSLSSFFFPLLLSTFFFSFLFPLSSFSFLYLFPLSSFPFFFPRSSFSFLIPLSISSSKYVTFGRKTLNTTFVALRGSKSGSNQLQNVVPCGERNLLPSGYFQMFFSEIHNKA